MKSAQVSEERQESLKRSEERFRSVFDDSGLGMALVSPEDGSFLRINSALCKLLGYSEQELLSKTFKGITHPDDLEASREQVRRALVGELSTYQTEKRYLHRDGHVVWASVSTSLVRDAEGIPLHFTTQIQDITRSKRTEEALHEAHNELENRVDERTAELVEANATLRNEIVERKKAEEALRESERQHRFLSESMPQIVWTGRPDGWLDYYNRRWFDYTGLTLEQAQGWEWESVLHPDDVQKCIDAWSKAVQTGEPYEIEYRFKRASDGTYRWHLGRALPMRDEEGRIVKWFGTSTDIDDQKRSQEALQEQQSFLRQVIDTDPNLVFLKDWNGRFILANKAVANLYGTTVEELAGKSDADFNSNQEEVECFLRADREVMASLRTKHISEPVTDSRTGEVRWFQTVKVPLASSPEEPGRILGVSTDVTERKRAEEALREARDELEMRVEERTSELAKVNTDLEKQIAERKQAQEELVKAREVAEASNRTKSEFLASMSHEIRTPMNGVIGMTEILLDTELSEEQRDYAKTVRTSGENLLTIINDILDFSKIESGKVDIEARDFDLLRMVEHVSSLLAQHAHGKGLELIGFVESNVPSALRSDPGRLRQILTNLLGNAIKFAEEGEVLLRVGLQEERDGSALVRFEVRDTGIGMTKEQMERLFQPFTQADASTTRRYGGTGLGLSISKQLIELMGGQIGVESEWGIGSTFWFTVPLQKQPRGSSAARRNPPADLKALRSLIVDDNETNRKILCKELSSWGMKVVSAKDGPSALEKLRFAKERGEPCDTALLDLHMPGMDGMELAREIKADPLIASVRLIMLTSMGERGHAGEARQAGIEAYLVKPVRQSELHDTLATMMSESVETAAPKEETSLITRHSLREGRTARTRVLVAEDNPVNQKVALKMLEGLGYRVNVVGNGRQALEALEQVPYAAILMDVQMPEMDGYKATAEIRRREEDKLGNGGYRTPIIAMTANAMQGDREKALEAGMDDYVPKPVRSGVLGAVLKRWLPKEAEVKLREPDVDALPMVSEEDAKQEALEDPLDREALEGLRELGGSELIAELSELFSSGTSPQLANLRVAVEGGDVGSVERIAHTLKGSSANLGARQMAGICEELQEAGASRELTETLELLSRLEAEFKRVRRALVAEAP